MISGLTGLDEHRRPFTDGPTVQVNGYFRLKSKFITFNRHNSTVNDSAFKKVLIKNSRAKILLNMGAFSTCCIRHFLFQIKLKQETFYSTTTAVEQLKQRKSSNDTKQN